VNLLPVIFTALTIAMAMGAILGSRIPLSSQDVESATNLGQVLPDPALGDDLTTPETNASPPGTLSPSPSPAQTPAAEDPFISPTPQTDSGSSPQNIMAQDNQTTSQDAAPVATSTTASAASSEIEMQPRQTSGEAIPALW